MDESKDFKSMEQLTWYDAGRADTAGELRTRDPVLEDPFRQDIVSDSRRTVLRLCSGSTWTTHARTPIATTLCATPWAPSLIQVHKAVNAIDYMLL